MTPPEQAVGPAVECEVDRVYVWDAVVRVVHWVIAASLFVLAITGIYIGNPFLIARGAPDELSVMATVKVVHFYFAITFTLAVALRVLWWFAGTYYSSWRELVPTTARRRRDFIRMFRFYVFLDKSPPLNIGHNPLAGTAYLLVYGLYFLQILTGLALYSVSATGYMEMWQFLLPIFGGAQTVRWIHHLVMWFLLGFFAHHIWSVILMARVEGYGFIDSLFSGYKFLPWGWQDRDE
jgi:Ni/Fe-hydrogenase 1 B-type cytochrome subunit